MPGLDLHVWFLDDGTLVGDVDKVLEALKIIEAIGPTIGCHLNMAKCELWWPTMSDTSLFPSSIRRVHQDGVELLGSPIGTDSFIQQYVTAIQVDLDGLDQIIGELNDTQTELSLLRGCLSFGKINHLLRACPPATLFPVLDAFDKRLHRVLATLLCVPSLSDSAWSQSALPVRMGGLGLFHASDIASSAYLGSCALTHDLVSTMLRQSPETFVPLHFQDIFTSHQSTYNTVHSVSEVLGKSHVQRIFSQDVWNARLKTLLGTADLQS